MTRPRRKDGEARACPADRTRAYRRAATRPPVRTQVDGLLAELDRLQVLTARGDLATARGAALTAAHAALALVVTPAVDEDDRRLRRDTLLVKAVPDLERAGLDHVGGLVAAALVHDGDPAALARGVGTPQ